LEVVFMAHRASRALIVLSVLAFAAGCGSGSTPATETHDASTDQKVVATDSGTQDSTAADSTVADTAPADAGIDSTVPGDASMSDTEVPETSVPDSGELDTGAADTGEQTDTGAGMDSGSGDSGSGSGDSGTADGGTGDSGTADGGGDGGDAGNGLRDAGPAPDAATYTVGGMVSGLAGASVVLENGGANMLTVSQNGTFTFSAPAADGAAYAVTVLTQPTNPSQICVVSNGTGNVMSANVTTVTITCTISDFTVGGTLSGLVAGNSITLRDNGGNDLPLTSNGAFTFTTSVASGQPYVVTVFTQPGNPAQVCAVSAGSGTVGAGNVTSVAVNCSAGTFTISGLIQGLAGGDSIKLLDNGGDPVFGSTNGAFAFPTPVASGAMYNVTIGGNPGSPVPQTCTVMNGAGTALANVTNVVVSCTTNPYLIGYDFSAIPQCGSFCYFDEPHNINLNGPSVPISCVQPAPINSCNNNGYNQNAMGQLVDGIKGVDNWTTDLGNGSAYEWVGWSGQNVTLTFQFAAVRGFSTITIGMDNFDPGDVTQPAEIDIAFSNNGSTYTPVQKFVKGAGMPQIASGLRADIPFSVSGSGAYVQITAITAGWTFLDEITFQ
jgi:hypothetical protein